MRNAVLSSISLLLTLTAGMAREVEAHRYGRLCSTPLMAASLLDTNKYIEEEDIELDEDTPNRDQYRGRSKWSADQFSRLADSVGIESRTGQSAAVAHIITSMKQGNMQAARTRLQKLIATPGYMLDPDVAQVLIALDMVLKNDKPLAKVGGKSARIDTVYVVDTVYREITRVDTVRVPERTTEPNPTEPDTVFVEVVKYDTIYVDKYDEEDPMKELAGSSVPDPTIMPPQSNTNIEQNGAQDPIASRVEKLTSEVIRLQQEVQNRNQSMNEAAITRRCFTILVSTHTERKKAEAEVQRLRKRYKRTRLAISNGASTPYAVIVGYYESSQVAKDDAEMLSRTTGHRCRAVATTIAERL